MVVKLKQANDDLQAVIENLTAEANCKIQQMALWHEDDMERILELEEALQTTGKALPSKKNKELVKWVQ